MIVVLLVLWVISIATIGWVANDATRRQRSWFGWAFLVGNTGVLGLALWLYARRRPSAAAANIRSSPGRRALLWLAAFPVATVNALIGLFIVTFLLQVARIDGKAMAPTLNDHDRVIVNKLAYRFRPPQRGDIVMHRYPVDPRKLFVKRVIAIDGDTVRIVDGHVYVNDVALQDDYVPDDFRSHDNWGPLAIQQGYFVMGDHRNNSSDSRHWGVVKRQDVLGRVQGRWPFRRLFGSD